MKILKEILESNDNTYGNFKVGDVVTKVEIQRYVIVDVENRLYSIVPEDEADGYDTFEVVDGTEIQKI